jgi:polyribonucleotide nucleotidyltransferase
VLSADSENDTDVLAITGASAALALSEIPVREDDRRRPRRPRRRPVRRQPDLPAAQESKLDLVVAGSRTAW